MTAQITEELHKLAEKSTTTDAAHFETISGTIEAVEGLGLYANEYSTFVQDQLNKERALLKESICQQIDVSFNEMVKGVDQMDSAVQRQIADVIRGVQEHRSKFGGDKVSERSTPPRYGYRQGLK